MREQQKARLDHFNTQTDEAHINVRKKALGNTNMNSVSLYQSTQMLPVKAFSDRT